jgi:hypothetical protein
MKNVFENHDTEHICIITVFFKQRRKATPEWRC